MEIESPGVGGGGGRGQQDSWAVVMVQGEAKPSLSDAEVASQGWGIFRNVRVALEPGEERLVLAGEGLTHMNRLSSLVCSGTWCASREG